MKYQNIEVVTAEELLRHIGARVENNHVTSKSGGKRGGQRKTAREYGILPQQLDSTLSGYTRPPKKVLEAENLEKLVVYVRKGGSDE